MHDKMKAPVVMVGYSRPRTLSMSLDRLAECSGVRNRDICLYLDAPARAEDERACDAMRQVAEEKRAHALPQLKIVLRDRNFGVPGNLMSAITENVNQFGRIVFFEDDVCVSRTFLTYMDSALDLYESDSRIFCINGYHSPHAALPLSFPGDVLLTTRNAAWGFGIWKDRWNAVDFDMRRWSAFKQVAANLERLNGVGRDLYRMIEDQLNGRVHTWDVQCTFHMVANGLRAVEPRLSLTKNIGYGEQAVHCQGAERCQLAARYYDFQPRLPNDIVYDEALERAMSGFCMPQTFLERMRRKYLNVFRGTGTLTNLHPLRPTVFGGKWL